MEEVNGDVDDYYNNKAKYIRKLHKIKKKWAQYELNAQEAGLDVTAFCNQTCANECFTAEENKDVPVPALLTSCIVSKCHCFKPEVPDAGYDMLVDF